MANYQLDVLPEHLAVCRLTAGSPIPESLFALPFWSLTQTSDELSLVLPEAFVPPDCQVEMGWKAIKIVGPLDFDLVGVLASLAVPLAQAGISIFAISTFNTDYILVRSGDLVKAVQTLTESGFIFTE
jgi:hypothetical protein